MLDHTHAATADLGYAGDGPGVATGRTAEPDAAEPSADGIMNLGFGFWGAKALLSAVELDLFTELAAAPLNCETLARRLGLHRRGAEDFFDALVALGMLERRDGRYCNTPEADLYLDRRRPTYVGGMLCWANARIYRNWDGLTESLRTGEPLSAGDGDLFDGLYADPRSVALFAAAMTGSSLPVARALAHRFPWADYRSFVDVGTAEGGAAAEICRIHPHLLAAGLDLPALRPVFDAYIARRGLGDRVRFHSGNFLDEPLPSADVLVMGQILHNWDAATKRMLLAKAYRALPVGGALVVYDQMIDDGRKENAAGLLMSLNMLLRTRGGFDYTGSDCFRWMAGCGFTDIRRRHLCGGFSMIAGVKGTGAAVTPLGRHFNRNRTPDS